MVDIADRAQLVAAVADAAAVRRRLCGDPTRWLPRPASHDGLDQFHCRMGVLGFDVTVWLQIGDPWVVSHTVSRHVRAQVGVPHSRWRPVRIEGELTVEEDPVDGAMVRYDAHVVGRGGRDARGARRLLGRVLARRLLAAVAGRLASTAPD